MLHGIKEANKVAKRYEIRNLTIKPIIPKMKPVIAIPLESSIMIPNIPKIIATIGNTHPIIEMIGKMLGMKKLHKSRIAAVALITKPKIPVIKATIPKAFPIFITKIVLLFY